MALHLSDLHSFFSLYKAFPSQMPLELLACTGTGDLGGLTVFHVSATQHIFCLCVCLLMMVLILLRLSERNAVTEEAQIELRESIGFPYQCTFLHLTCGGKQ
jgi:hypothetical protein